MRLEDFGVVTDEGSTCSRSRLTSLSFSRIRRRSTGAAERGGMAEQRRGYAGQHA